MQTDKKILEKGIELAKGTVDRIYEDNFNIYKAFTTAEEKMYLSYSSSDMEGKSLRQSILVSRIKKIFTKLQEESDIIQRKSEICTKQNTFEELLINLRDFRDGKEIDPIWFNAALDCLIMTQEWKPKLESAIKALSYTNVPEKITKENVEKMYGDVLKTSVSRLEQYSSLPHFHII